MNSALPLFELNGVTRNFGDFPAVRDITIKISPGERAALVGPSGAGKSKLINLMNGTLLPSSGEVYVLGKNLAGLTTGQLRQIQSQIGTIYQQFNLVDSLRVIHNVNAGNLGRWLFPKALLTLINPLDVSTAANARRALQVA